MKFGKIQSIVSEEKFFEEKVYKCTHARTWLSLYKSIIKRTIEEICIYKFNLPKFRCSMHFSYEITQSSVLVIYQK